MEESENEMVNNLDESEESVDMIMVASSENSKKDEEILEGDLEAEEEGDVSAADEEEEEESELQSDDANDAKDNDDNVPAESEVVEETVVKKSPKPVQKKTKKTKDKGKQIDNYDVS